jgi:hypothetical protein
MLSQLVYEIHEHTWHACTLDIHGIHTYMAFIHIVHACIHTYHTHAAYTLSHT